MGEPARVGCRGSRQNWRALADIELSPELPRLPHHSSSSSLGAVHQADQLRDLPAGWGAQRRRADLPGALTARPAPWPPWLQSNGLAGERAIILVPPVFRTWSPSWGAVRGTVAGPRTRPAPTIAGAAGVDPRGRPVAVAIAPASDSVAVPPALGHARSGEVRCAGWMSRAFPREVSRSGTRPAWDRTPGVFSTPPGRRGPRGVMITHQICCTTRS